MSSIETTKFKTPFGALILGSFEGQLCLCDWYYRKLRNQVDERLQKGLGADFADHDSAVIKETKKQLNAYFESKRRNFNLPLLLVGSDFQKSVWKELLVISFGQTRTYLELSQSLGNEKAIRAVAAANGANSISIIVPCHRIIGTNGDLVGYAGGIEVKKRLLELEHPDNITQMSLF